MNKKIAVGLMLIAGLLILVFAFDSRSPSADAEPKSERAPASAQTSPVVKPKEKRAKKEAAGIAAAKAGPLAEWQADNHPSNGTVRTYFGGKIDLPGASVNEKAESFVRLYSKELFGIPEKDLLFERSSRAARTKVTYRQTVGGYPLYGSTLSLLFEGDDLQRVQNDLQPAPRLPAAAPKSFEKAFESYKANPSDFHGGAVTLEKIELASEPGLEPRLMLYPGATGLAYVYQFYVDEKPERQPASRAMILFDPDGGNVVKKINVRKN